MSFAYPWVLLLILPAMWLLKRRKEEPSFTVSSVSLWPRKRSGRTRWLWVPVFLRRLCVVLVIVALASPQAGKTFERQVNQGIAIQMLVDVSSSMDMRIDGGGTEGLTRMEVARELVERFIAGDGEELSGRPNDLIGLITFARYADTRSPLTFGHEGLLQIVRQIEIQDRPNEDGTAFGDALAIAAARLKSLEELKESDRGIDIDSITSKVIILLTDGENNSGNHLPLGAAGLAKEWGCRIYVISLGESEAGFQSDQGEVRNLSGADQVLELIATETGGLFRQASDFESLLSVYSEIDKLERAEISIRSFERLSNWFWLPLIQGMAALVIALILEATWLRVIP
ncbi:MAG: VWA domain-containing protein [Verrucomicrobiota bacterium]